MYKKYGKRIFDVVVALLALVVLSPIMLVLTCQIKKKLGHPVIFKQMRPGKDGRIFCMYKFRSMTDERDEAGELLPDHVRLTDFGRKLRLTSLDELPELINILRGDMSLVGPRPQLVRDMVFFNEAQQQRQSVYPGLTGLAQISGRNNITWEEKFKYDLLYIQRITFYEDFRILYRTIFAVAEQEGISPDDMETGEDYGDYLLRLGKIDKAAYNAGQKRAQELLDEVGK